MNNVVGNTSGFILEGFFFQPEARVPLFLLTLFVYIIIVFVNVTLFLVIAFHKNLHGPMYVMLCNLIVFDLIGSSALMPRLMSDFFVDVKIISFEACIIQALCVSIYHIGAHLILTVMAFDRYVAICKPLHYTTIMTARMLVKLCLFAWGSAIAVILVISSTTLRLTKCSSLIVHAYCFNGAIFVLACGDYSMNNILGLSVTYCIAAFSLSSIAFTYAKILSTCFLNSQNNPKTKAMYTCVSHITVYALFETTLLFSILSMRFPNISPNLTKTFGTLMITVPPCMNPLIYGINTKEIRNSALRTFKNKIIFK